MKFQKPLIVIVGLAFLLSVISGGCFQKQNAGNADNDTQLSISNEVVNTNEPDEISIFYGTAGLKTPEGMKLDNNAYLNKISELANVKFKEVTVPDYSDFQTKFNLMVSSGSIPDFVHCWFPDDVQMYGKAGTFIDLSDVIAQSPVILKSYSQSMINMMKDENNKIYALRSLPPKDAQAAGIRMDLLDEINGGNMPVTPDEWYEVFKKLKEKYPDSIPYSSAGVTALNLFFKAFGVDIGNAGAEWQYKDGKIFSAFEAPLFKDAILFHRKLYSEGLLDKAFATNKLQDYLDRKWNKKLIIGPNNLNSVIAYIGNYVANNVKGAIIAAGPLPRVNDPRVTDADVYTEYELLGSHCVAISASSQKKNAVVRLIETLLSDEIRELTTWGFKEVDFSVQNGQKTVTAKSSETLSLRKMYSFMFTYGSEENVLVSLADNLAKIEPKEKDKYILRVNEGINITYDQASKVKPNPKRYIQLSADSLLKVKQAQNLSRTIIIRAILGEISMEEFDAQVADYIKKFKSITEEYNTKLPAMEAILKN